jgi:hypothetical protein
MARMTAPESIGSESTYLEHTAANAGKHVMLVVDAHDNGRPTKDGIETINGFSAECEVIGSGANNGKKFTLTLYGPKLTSKDGGKFAIQKQFAFLIATDVATPDMLGKEFDFDPVSSLGSVFVIDLALGEKNDNGKQYLDLAWSNIYHVDDPRSKMKFDDVQRAKIATVAASNRHPSDYFEKLVASKTAKKEAAKDSKPLDLDDL